MVLVKGKPAARFRLPVKSACPEAISPDRILDHRNRPGVALSLYRQEPAWKSQGYGPVRSGRLMMQQTSPEATDPPRALERNRGKT